MKAAVWTVTLGAATLASACAVIVGIEDMSGPSGGDASVEAATDAKSEQEAGSVDGGVDVTDGDTGACTTSAQLPCADACAPSQQCVVGHCLTPAYVGPNGDDTNDGRTPSTAWKTFGRALDGGIDVGSALVVLPGVYPPLLVTCGALNGNSSTPIVVTALDERTATFQSDGTTSAIALQSCKNWVLDGLTATTKDAVLPADSGATVNTVEVVSSSNILLRRLLVNGNNRSAGANALDIQYGTNTRIVETEVYRFSRTGLSAQGSNFEIERVYLNPLGVADPDGSVAGQYGIAWFGNGGQSLFENVVAEGTNYGFYGGFGGNSSDVRLLGSIVLGPGSVGVGIETDDSLVVRDLVVANTGNGNVYFRQPVNADVSNATLLYSGGLDLATWGADASPGIVANSVSAFGTRVGVSVSSPGTWAVESTNSSGNAGGDFQPPIDAGYCEGCWQLPPTGLGFTKGQCVVYVPPGSNLADASPEGGPVGANIVYRYEDGGLTTTPLWACGHFPCGAVDPSINDPGDASVCMNLASRLNFVDGGCPFPTP